MLQRIGQVDFDLVRLAQFHVDRREFDHFSLGAPEVEFVPELPDGVGDEPECATACEGQQGGELEVVFLILQGVDVEDALSDQTFPFEDHFECYHFLHRVFKLYRDLFGLFFFGDEIEGGFRVGLVSLDFYYVPPLLAEIISKRDRSMGDA